MRESQVQSRILLALSEAGCLVWRCETAGAWVGRVIHQSHGTVTIADARMIQAGLTTGGADIIGIAPDGRFLAVEVKTSKGRIRPEQTKFLQAVKNAGGIAGVARSVDDALQLLP
jgi:hypothetical protein